MPISFPQASLDLCSLHCPIDSLSTRAHNNRDTIDSTPGVIRALYFQQSAGWKQQQFPMASRSRPQSSTQKSEPALIGAADAPAGKARRPFSSPVKAPRANTAQPRPRAQGGGDSTAPSGLAVRAPDDDSEISDILDTAPPLTVTRSPMKLAIATGGDQTLAAKQPLNTKQFAYTRRASSAGSRRVILSKDAMELEMKEMRSFNRDVYETRVRQNYLEEQVARKLYAQKISMQRHARLAEERARHDGRIQREFALGTPFLRERAKAEALQKTMDAARANMRMRGSLSTRSLYAAAFPSISIRSLYAASRALINWEILCNAVLRDEVDWEYRQGRLVSRMLAWMYSSRVAEPFP